MGDYTKLIVNCSLKNMEKEELEKFKSEIEERIYICSSAYHCGGEVFELDDNWHHRTDLTIVTQIKWGRGISEFLDWLKPQIVGGFGEKDYFAVEMNEYDDAPKLHRLN